MSRTSPWLLTFSNAHFRALRLQNFLKLRNFEWMFIDKAILIRRCKSYRRFSLFVWRWDLFNVTVVISKLYHGHMIDLIVWNLNIFKMKTKTLVCVFMNFNIFFFLINQQKFIWLLECKCFYLWSNCFNFNLFLLFLYFFSFYFS